MPNKSVSGRAVRVSSPGAPLKLEMREFAAPNPGDVRLRVQACGICHSDSLTKEGLFPGIPYPISPGHEVIGLVEALGDGVTTWSLGQRVGVGWYGGHCGVCDRCRRGDFVLCQKAMIPGVTFDGGYADYLNVPAQALAAIPDSLTSAEAGPLLCAGITTFNALRHSGATAGDLVAILGVGGLGHLGVQFANKMGFRTVAIARGQDKAEFVKKLGAHHYIDTVTQDVAKELTNLGGAKVIIATLNNADAMSAAMGGLGPDGKFVMLGVPQEPVKVPPVQLILRRQTVTGWPSGVAADSEDTLKFSEMSGVKAMIERYPLEKTPEAYDRMMSGEARFRVVVETGA